MPIHVTKFPSKDFDEQFEEWAANVWSYFDKSREIGDAVRQFVSKSKSPKSKSPKSKSPKSKSPKSKAKKGKANYSYKPVIEQFMHEYDVKESFVRQAKQSGEAFDDDHVREILELCQKHGVLPSRDLFIQLVPVPKNDRMKFAKEMISQGLSTRMITQVRIERYGRTSKGTKKPKSPASLFEAKEQAIKLDSRVNHICEVLLQAAGVDEGRTSHVDFEAPAEVVPALRTWLKATREVRKLLEEAVDGDSAA